MLIFPLIPVGLSTEHVNFCGSVTLKPDTFYHVLYDICKGWRITDSGRSQS